MPTDRLLNTVLGAYQNVHDADRTNRLLSSTTSLLTTLSNPLNVTLLTSQLLTAPAIWDQVPGLSTSLRIISIFNTAAITVHRYELESRKPDHFPRQGGGISSNDWARAVIKGADERSARWKHLLVLTGVLLGMEGQDRNGLSSGLRATLERGVAIAANLSLSDPARDGVLGAESIALSLIHAYPLLSDIVARSIDYDALAPILLRAMIGNEGYEEGYFFGSVDLDVRQATGNKWEWSSKSNSFSHLQRLGKKPLISSIGSLAKLMAHCVDNCSDSRRLSEYLDDLVHFTSSILFQWRSTKLSEIDPSEEDSILTADTKRITYPFLWQTLKTAMFAIVVILRSIVGRTLIDPVLTTPVFAPQIAAKALRTLRNISFVTEKLGTNAFSAYTFVSLSAIDILNHYPAHAQQFLTSILPPHTGIIPPHPLDRNLDLFYLNTCEHFTLSLTPPLCDSLILAPAHPYLSPTAHPSLLASFESAHSATLSVLSAPQNESLRLKTLPHYTNALFASFPQPLSATQFRFAFKTLMSISSSPSSLTHDQLENLPDILAEMLHDRALHASNELLPQPQAQTQSTQTSQSPTQQHPKTPDLPLSIRTHLTLTLISSLPHIPSATLPDWLSQSATLIHTIPSAQERSVCQKRMWEVLCDASEMDVERAVIGMGWWNANGGREAVLFGNKVVAVNEEKYLMSGGLGETMRGEKSRL